MNSDQTQTLESSIPRRGRPPRKSSPQKRKSSLGLSLSGVRKPRPRAVKLVLPSVQAAVPNLAKVANKSSEIVKTFPIASAKDSPPITTFLLTATNGKTGPLTPVSKSGSLPMNLVQHVTSADPTSIKQFPVAVSSNILPQVQLSTSTASSPKLLLITTASNSAVSIPTTSANQTLCNTLLPVKLSNNTSNPSSMVAGNLGKQVLYQIPSSQGSGMVLLSTTVPLQSGVAPKKYLLIPSSTTTKRQSNAAVILNSQISHSVVDQPVTSILTPIQTTSLNSSPIDFSKIPTTIVPITSNLAETASKKLTRQSAVNSSSQTKRVNTSRRRGSIHGANSTISSIPSGIFQTVACTTNSRGICSTPVSIQISQKASNVKLTQVGGLAPFNPLISAPMQQMSAFTHDASLNVTIPTVPEASLKTNLFNQSSNNNYCSSITSVNACTLSKTLSDSKQPSAVTESRKQSKRSRPLPGQRAKKTISKIDQNEGSTSSSFITVPSSLPFSAIQLKTNCSTAPASSFSGLSWVVSPNTGHQQKKSSLNSENGTKDLNMPAKYKTMPKLIVVNGLSNTNFSTTPSANSQTSDNGCQVGIFSANEYPECSKNARPIYASPPKLTIAPGFSTPDKTGSELGKKKRPSELMIIKEREEFIDDSMEKSNIEDLSPPKLQREDGTDLSGAFIFEMPTPIQSSSPYLSLAKSASTAQAKSISQLPSALSIRNQYQSFCHEIKPIIRKDNFPTLASLSAILNNKCSEFISRLDKNRKLSFGQLFNHFKLLADKKKNKKNSSHSAIMFQVAHSLHCCVVLAKINVDGSVDLKDLPFCVEKSMKCSVKCRQTFMKEVFAEKGIYSLDPRLSILKSSDSTRDERSAQCHRSKSTTNLSSANETVTPELSKIKIELPESDKYPPDDQQENLTNSAFVKKPTANLTSEASTQKFTTDIDESFSSYSSISPHSDCKCLMRCSQNPCANFFTPTSANQPIHSVLSKDSSNSTSCTNSRTRAQNRGKCCLCNGKCKKTHSSICSSQHKIKNVCNNENESSPILKVSSQVLAGKLRYKIVPKGHISLSGKTPEIESNCMKSSKGKSKFPVQSYIINGDKSSVNPIQTISPVLAPSTELHKDETKNLTDSNLDRKKKRRLPSLKPCGENTPRKKICKGKMTTIPSIGISHSKASNEEGCSKSSPSAKLSLALVERPLSVRDPKHLYDEPTTVDRVVMLTPDGKPILPGTHLQMTFHDSCLPSLKKRGKPSKGESPIKSSPTKRPSSSSSCSILKKSSSAKDKVQGRHSKSSSTNNQFSRPPKLNFLLRELEHKCKYKYLSASPPTTNSTKTNDSMFHKTYLDREKSKKANIEQIINNIASGFPAFGPGRPRCTMKLYKYFVSTRIKNRAKKDGSHEINTPLVLYINWKTLSRQPFNKHRITNHTLNIMAIKNAKQFANFKKCKSRSKMCKPVKNKPLFMKRRRALLALRNRKTKKNSNKSKKQTNKRHSKCLHQSRSSKTKRQNTKTSSSSKKKALVPKLEGTMVIKTEKTDNSTELAAIAEREKSKIDARKNKTLKSAEKKFKVPQFKRSKQVNKKRLRKKCSSLPVLRTTRSRNALPGTPHADSEKVGSFCEASNQIEIQSENTVMKKSVTRTTKLNQPEILNGETKSNESDPLHHINNLEDEDFPSRIKSADLMMEKEKPADIKQDITKSQTEHQENNNSITEMVASPIPSNSTIVKTRDSLQGTERHEKKFTSSMKKDHSKAVAEQFTKAPEEPFSEKEDANIDNSDQALSLASANNPVDENAEVATHQQLSSPTIIEDSGNFIFEDYVEPSLPVMDNAPMLCDEDKQLNSIHSSLSVDNNQPVISNKNTCTSFINVTPTSRRSSAFSDKFDIGLSPELARIQKLKDQLQEKQKALDLAKLYLK